MIEKMNNLVPIVVEQTGSGERSYDIYSRLLKDRIVFIDGEINDVNADLVVAQLLFLDGQETEKEINLYINSPGGTVTAGLAIYDTMQYVKSKVQTICIGQAASMASLIFAGGEPGMRMALPSARILIHQPWVHLPMEQASDIIIKSKEINRQKNLIIEYLSKHTGHPIDKIATDIERDLYMSAQESVSYGIADKILTREKDGSSS